LIDGQYGFSSEYVENPEPYTVNGGDGRTDGDGPYRKEVGPHKGTVYIVCGVTAGSHGTPNPTHPVMYTSPSDAGTLVIDVEGNTLEYKFLNDKGEIKDYFTLIKGPEMTGVDAGTAAKSGANISFNGATLEIDPETQGSYKLRLTDIKGNTVLDKTLSGKTALDVSRLPQGIYLAKLKGSTVNFHKIMLK
jgi:hypothetical protein